MFMVLILVLEHTDLETLFLQATKESGRKVCAQVQTFRSGVMSVALHL